MTVGTQAAVLASLDITMFIEFTPPHDSEWGNALIVPRVLKFFYYVAITSAFCANILVVAHTTLLSLLGSSLALRGPDGSMITATDGLYEERMKVFSAFGFGLVATMVSIVLLVWIMFSPEISVVCMTVAITTAFHMYSSYCRIRKKFRYDENETVDFTDIFEGPAAIKAMPSRKQKSRISRGERRKYQMYEDSSSYDSMSETENGRWDRSGFRRSESSPHLSQNGFEHETNKHRDVLSSSEHIHRISRMDRLRRAMRSASPARQNEKGMPII